MLITKTVAAASLSIVVNGVPLQANLLQGNVDGCSMAAHSAKQWRLAGQLVVKRQVGQWCVAGKVVDGNWIAEQWQSGVSGDRKSRGWLVQLALPRTGPRMPTLRPFPWQLDIFDPQISTRIRYWQSHLSRDAHDQRIRSYTPRHALILTQPHPDGGSYSTVIERGVTP